MEKKSLGSFIALLRKEKRLTQKQLAELLNVSDKTVSHWECDETSPDISILPEFAETLGVSVVELYYPSLDTIVFNNPEDFKTYMETPKEKP